MVAQVLDSSFTIAIASNFFIDSAISRGRDEIKSSLDYPL
jgi:hypothetical protein